MKENLIVMEAGGVITLPKEAWEKIGVKPGDKVKFSIEGLEDEICVIQKA